MDAILKWIGGATVVVGLVLAGTAIGGAAIAESEPGRASRSIAARSVPLTAPAPAQGPQSAIAARIAADATRPFVIKRILPIEGPIEYGEWHWDEEGVPEGPLLITVDLDARTISVFRDGYEIGAAAVMLGTDEHPTPTGTFPILSKERHNVSEEYSNAPMPWTLRLTHDGIAIHGGNEVENGYASHGCIGIPNELAERLFDEASKGDKVVITDGRRIGVGDPIV